MGSACADDYICPPCLRYRREDGETPATIMWRARGACARPRAASARMNCPCSACADISMAGRCLRRG
eukprot:8946533-Pyramimonas_sp.AAC.1